MNLMDFIKLRIVSYKTELKIVTDIINFLQKQLLKSYNTKNETKQFIIGNEIETGRKRETKLIHEIEL